jgi:hypothetical protein
MREGERMTIREVPRVLFSAEVSDSAGQGLVVARMPSAEIAVQIVLGAEHLRRCTPERPPAVTMPPEAALDLARALLAELAPDLAAALEAHERRAGIRLVVGGGDDLGPEAA